MNILFISSWYPNSKNPNFGVFVKEHAHAIKIAGNNIVVLAIVINRGSKIYSSKTMEYFDENNVRTILINIESKFRDLLYHLVPFQYWLLKKVYNTFIKTSFYPDLIHSNVVFPAGMLGFRLSKYLNKPHVITEHWSRIESALKKPYLSSLLLKTYLDSERILPVSEFLKNEILALLPQLNEVKIKVIGNVIDTKVFQFKEKNVNADSLEFVAVASWTNKKKPDKIPELFINALSKVKDQVNQEIHLIMIGGGDKIPELKALCNKNRLQCDFTGFVPKTQIAVYLRKANFLLHASTIETFGVGVAEALFCGTPVICSNVGALPELVNTSNGILCDNFVDEWVEGIKKALRTNYNHEEISENIKSKYSLCSIGNEVNKIYHEVID